jgi:hypothetical protein
VAYNYHDSAIRDERVSLGTDHCDSDGQVFELGSIFRDGLLYDPREDDALLDSTKTIIIFAVDEAHRFHLGFDGLRGQPSTVKHETLFHNANVLAAGELIVRQGIIVDVNDHPAAMARMGNSTPSEDSRGPFSRQQPSQRLV